MLCGYWYKQELGDLDWWSLKDVKAGMGSVEDWEWALRVLWRSSAQAMLFCVAVPSMEDEPTQAFLFPLPQEPGPSSCSFQATGMRNSRLFCAPNLASLFHSSACVFYSL